MQDIPLSVDHVGSTWSDSVLALLRLFAFMSVFGTIALLHHCFVSTHRTRFCSANALKLTSLLLTVLPRSDNSGDLLLNFEELYELIWSHTEFMSLMSSEKDDKLKGM